MKNKTSEEIILEIEKLNQEQQFECDHYLGSWEWPDLIKKFKPDWWDKIPEGKFATELHYIFISPICNHFRNKFGRKEELRYHNVRSSRKTMTNSEFEEWWIKYSGLALKDYKQ